MNSELEALNDALLEKSGTLPPMLANSITGILKGSSKEEIKNVLGEIDSKMMLNRIFTSSFCKQEFDICLAIKEVLEERKEVLRNK